MLMLLWLSSGVSKHGHADAVGDNRGLLAVTSDQRLVSVSRVLVVISNDCLDPEHILLVDH